MTAQKFELRNGAEAIVELIGWHGEQVIKKKRLRKTYRDEYLDRSLRSRRTKEEAFILHSAKLAGVPCPRLLFADPEDCDILMEYVKGPHLKELTEQEKKKKELGLLLVSLGETIAKLHKGKIAHGDLTTKNIIIRDGNTFLIDFGLSFFSERVEDRADDLHLLKQALKSSSPFFSYAFSKVMIGYEKEIGKKYATLVARQILEIEKRGRYARVD